MKKLNSLVFGLDMAERYGNQKGLNPTRRGHEIFDYQSFFELERLICRDLLLHKKRRKNQNRSV